MSPRTLRNWRCVADTPVERKVGRPPRCALSWLKVAHDVQKALAACGKVGWRTVHAWLCGLHSTDAVQRALAWLKARTRRKAQAFRAEHALHIAVLAAGTVWSVDGTHLGRDVGGQVVEGQNLKDNGSRLLLVADLGPAVTGQDVVDLLEAARRAMGGLPVALITDNGPPYVSKTLTDYLKRHHIVHILNLPYTPQHNGACEQIHGELKAEAGLGKGVVIESLQDAAQSVAAAQQRLNHRPRAVLGGVSATEQHRSTAKSYSAATREDLYVSCHCAMEKAESGPGTARERRLAARRAALATLESYGIITITRGSDDCHAVKPEEVS